jgi:hypothetical protein
LVAYSDLLDNAYSTIREFRRGDVVSPRLLPKCSIPVDALLP